MRIYNMRIFAFTLFSKFIEENRNVYEIKCENKVFI